MARAWLVVAAAGVIYLGSRRAENRAARRVAALEAELASERERHRAALDAERAASSACLHRLAHDLANPLTSILSSLDLLTELEAEREASLDDPRSSDAEQRALAEEMRLMSDLARAASVRAASLVGGLRARARELRAR